MCCIHIADNYSKAQIGWEFRFRWEIHYLQENEVSKFLLIGVLLLHFMGARISIYQ